MADLLRSLVQPGSKASEQNSSQESFKSFSDEVVTGVPSGPPPSTAANHENPALGRLHPMSDFLSDPANEAVESTAAVQGSQSHPAKSGVPSTPKSLQPIELSRSANYVSALYTLCQARGLTPIFNIDGEADKALFRGTLDIAGCQIVSDRDYKSKKEVKEQLSERGIEVVKGIDENRQNLASADGDKNWIGKLQEYHDAEFGPAQVPVYTIYTLGLAFACTCVIASYPSEVFGSKTEAFAGKKQARANAAAQAVKFLISEQKLNPDGSTLSKKRVKLGGGNKAVKFQAQGNQLEVDKACTYVQKVHDIYPILNLTAPQYHIAPTSTNAPYILSGYATFSNCPHLPGPIGEVRNIYGKKDTKEEIAKGVWQVLADLAESRGVKLNDG